MSASPLVSPDQLQESLGDEDLVILDATVVLAAPRFDGDYVAHSGEPRWRASHIPGARFADLLGNLSDHAAPFHFAVPAPGALATALRDLGVADGRRVVVYDGESGLWAARLWWMLRGIGVTATVLDGGFGRWREEGRPVQSGDCAPLPGGPLTPRPDPGVWTDRATVEAVVRGEAPGTLVCALTADVFSGRTPTRYARRGAIPGSRNFPARELFDARGVYHSTAELQSRAAAYLAGAARPLILYCGGGISAAANALALTLVGETALSIYDGSLEEWAADPALPLVQSEPPAMR